MPGLFGSSGPDIVPISEEEKALLNEETGLLRDARGITEENNRLDNLFKSIILEASGLKPQFAPGGDDLSAEKRTEIESRLAELRGLPEGAAPPSDNLASLQKQLAAQEQQLASEQGTPNAGGRQRVVDALQKRVDAAQGAEQTAGERASAESRAEISRLEAQLAGTGTQTGRDITGFDLSPLAELGQAFQLQQQRFADEQLSNVRDLLGPQQDLSLAQLQLGKDQLAFQQSQAEFAQQTSQQQEGLRQGQLDTVQNLFAEQNASQNLFQQQSAQTAAERATQQQEFQAAQTSRLDQFFGAQGNAQNAAQAEQEAQQRQFRTAQDSRLNELFAQLEQQGSIAQQQAQEFQAQQQARLDTLLSDNAISQAQFDEGKERLAQEKAFEEQRAQQSAGLEQQQLQQSREVELLRLEQQQTLDNAHLAQEKELAGQTLSQEETRLIQQAEDIKQRGGELTSQVGERESSSQRLSSLFGRTFDELNTAFGEGTPQLPGVERGATDFIPQRGGPGLGSLIPGSLGGDLSGQIGQGQGEQDLSSFFPELQGDLSGNVSQGFERDLTSFLPGQGADLQGNIPTGVNRDFASFLPGQAEDLRGGISQGLNKDLASFLPELGAGRLSQGVSRQDGTLAGLGENELGGQGADITTSLRDKLQQILSGDTASNPGLEQRLASEEQTLQERLRSQGLQEGSTPFINAMSQFRQRAEAARFDEGRTQFQDTFGALSQRNQTNLQRGGLQLNQQGAQTGRESLRAQLELSQRGQEQQRGQAQAGLAGQQAGIEFGQQQTRANIGLSQQAQELQRGQSAGGLAAQQAGLELAQGQARAGVGFQQQGLELQRGQAGAALALSQNQQRLQQELSQINVQLQQEQNKQTQAGQIAAAELQQRQLNLQRQLQGVEVQLQQRSQELQRAGTQAGFAGEQQGLDLQRGQAQAGVSLQEQGLVQQNALSQAQLGQQGQQLALNRADLQGSLGVQQAGVESAERQNALNALFQLAPQQQSFAGQGANIVNPGQFGQVQNLTQGAQGAQQGAAQGAGQLQQIAGGFQGPISVFQNQRAQENAAAVQQSQASSTALGGLFGGIGKIATGFALNSIFPGASAVVPGIN